MQNTTVKPETVENGRFSTITIGDALFVGVLLIGLIMRFVGLGEQPLTPSEAESAWTAWAFWQPDSTMLAEGSPLYFSLTRLITPIVGFSDGSMRFVPAIFGLGCVLLPWLWRNRLGMIGSMTVALFLAVSPIHVNISRTAGSDTTAVFAILLLLIGVFQFIETKRRGWLYTAVTAFALGLSSTPLFYSGLVSLLGAYVIYRAIGLPLVDEYEEEAVSLEIEAGMKKTAVIIGVAVFISATTLFLWNPAGIGTAALLPANWINQFSFDYSNVADPFLSLFRYQPGLVLVGFLAMGWVTWRNHGLGSFFIYWFAMLVILAMLQPGEQSLTLLLTLPATFLVGIFANTHLSDSWDINKVLVACGSFLVLMLVWVNMARFLRIVTFDASDLTNLWIIIFAAVLAVFALFFLISFETDFIAQGGLLALLLFFVFYGWGTAWWLGHEGFHDTRERWNHTRTDDEVRVLVAVLDELSRQISNSDYDLDVLSRVDTAVLRWYLRDYDELEFTDTISATTNNAVILTPATTELALANDYFGSDYGLLRHQPELVTSEAVLLDTLRWWFFQESPTQIPEERVILWVRSDLSQE